MSQGDQERACKARTNFEAEMKPRHLLGLILLWSINECTGQGIVSNCTCKTFDGGIYAVIPLRRTDGKLRCQINRSKNPGSRYTYNLWTPVNVREYDPDADANKICRDVAIIRLTHLCSCGNGYAVHHITTKKPTTDHSERRATPCPTARQNEGQTVAIAVSAATGTVVFLQVA